MSVLIQIRSCYYVVFYLRIPANILLYKVYYWGNMLKHYIIKRILQEYEFISTENATVRQTAKAFDVSKSTVHKDISYRLYFIDKAKYFCAKKIFENNFEVKHIRGGEATKRKYGIKAKNDSLFELPPDSV